MTIFRCSLLGTLPSGEVFQLGVHTSDGGAGDLADMLTTWDDAATKLWTGNGTTIDGIGSVIPAGISTQEVTVASLSSTTGLQTDALAASLVLPGSSTSTAALPQEVSTVCTLRGASQNRRNRGRFYMPPLAVTALADTGLLDSIAQAVLADSCQYGLQALSGAGKGAVIWHRDLLTFTPITRIDIGNVMDSQRRRRNKIPETRLSRAL